VWGEQESLGNVGCEGRLLTQLDDDLLWSSPGRDGRGRTGSSHVGHSLIVAISPDERSYSIIVVFSGIDSPHRLQNPGCSGCSPELVSFDSIVVLVSGRCANVAMQPLRTAGRELPLRACRVVSHINIVSAETGVRERAKTDLFLPRDLRRVKACTAR
jgi:hypothetical protein